jgi:hypothetical protein
VASSYHVDHGVLVRLLVIRYLAHVVSGVPKDSRQLREWIQAKGFSIVPNGSGHYTVLRRNGTRVMNLAKTPSDVRAVANAWKRFLRALAKPPRNG